MIWERLYSIIQAALSYVAPVIVSAVIKSIPKNDWMPGASDSACVAIKKMSNLLYKGMALCAIYGAVLAELWDLRNHTLNLLFLSVFLWSYSIVVPLFFGHKISKFIAKLLIRNLVLEVILIISDCVFEGNEGGIAFLMGAFGMLNAICLYDSPYLKIIRIGSRKTIITQKLSCFSFSVGVGLFYYTSSIAITNDIDIKLRILGYFAIIFAIPLIVYIDREQKNYSNICKYSRMNIYLKDKQAFQNLCVWNIRGKGDWLCLCLSGSKEIRVNIHNVSYFEYFDV